MIGAGDIHGVARRVWGRPVWGALAALALAGCGASSDPPSPRAVPFHVVSTDGNTLRLSVQTGGPPCDGVLGVAVRETRAAVTVTVRAGATRGAKCPHGAAAVLGTFPVTARLAAPLGSRALRDGSR